jgi:hypothetical protein
MNFLSFECEMQLIHVSTIMSLQSPTLTRLDEEDGHKEMINETSSSYQRNSANTLHRDAH